MSLDTVLWLPLQIPLFASLKYFPSKARICVCECVCGMVFFVCAPREEGNGTIHSKGVWAEQRIAVFRGPCVNAHCFCTEGFKETGAATVTLTDAYWTITLKSLVFFGSKWSTVICILTDCKMNIIAQRAITNTLNMSWGNRKINRNIVIGLGQCQSN